MRAALLFYLVRASRAIWFLPALFSLLAVLALLISALWTPTLPSALADRVDLRVVDRILDIMASSMLAVAIFSLTTMVAAIQAATQAATPRVRGLLVADRTAQVTISIFIGTFLFSLLGVIGLSTGLYGQTGRLILFVLMLVIVSAVVVALIRWIQKLSHIGGVGEAVDRAEQATRAAFGRAAAFNASGDRHGARVEGLRAVSAGTIGYVQYVDESRLGRLANELSGPIVLVARPGGYVDPTRPLAFVPPDIEDSALDTIRGAFVVGRERTFDGDPAYGLVVLSEIALRALSPSINDPGTAIIVIGALTRLLDGWGQWLDDEEPQVRYPNLFLPDLDVNDLFTDAFAAIARDGAGMVEVQVRLQQSLATLAATRPERFNQAARRLSHQAIERATAVMTDRRDIELVARAAKAVGNETVVEPASQRSGAAEPA